MPIGGQVDGRSQQPPLNLLGPGFQLRRSPCLDVERGDAGPSLEQGPEMARVCASEGLPDHVIARSLMDQR